MQIARTRWRPLSLMLVLGCGQATTAGDAAIDASIASDAMRDVSIFGDSGVLCTGHDAAAFPSFDRSCAQDADCTIGPHQTDCCGTIAALGIARSERARFAAAEAICEAQYPGCGCDSGTVRTDDGSMPPPGSGVSAVLVRCASGTCTTSARASSPCGATTCTPSQVCITECSGIDAGVPPPRRCVDVPASCAGASDCGCYGTVNPCPVGVCVRVDHGAPVCMCA